MMWKRLFGMAAAELLLLMLVVIGLFWQFQGLRGGTADSADDNRYVLDQALKPGALHGYGQAQPATLCHGADLPPRLRWRWEGACAATRPTDAGDLKTFPQALQADYMALQQAIVAGEAARLARVAPMAKSLAEGVLPEQDQAQLAATTRELSAYRGRYQVSAAAQGSLTLACAWNELLARAARAANDDERVTLLANQLAVVRGTSARLWWPHVGTAGGGAASTWAAQTDPQCSGLGLPHNVIAQAAELARQVRDGDRLAHKATAMLELQHKAPWLLAGWALLTWLLVSLARPTQRPARYLAVALAVWAAVGAASRLALPGTGLPVPWWIWAVLAATGAVVAVGDRLPLLRSLLGPSPAQRNVSFVTLPMFVLFMGMGWWVVFDLAMNGHYRNRYIALSQALPIFGAFVLVSLTPALAHGVGRVWVAWASLVTNALRPKVGGPLRGWLRPVLIWMVYLVVMVGLALLTRNWRQFTGDAFRFWLLLGVSWFFMLRAARWSQPEGTGWPGQALLLLPLLVHLVAVVLAFLITDDLGPLLVVLFAGAVYTGGFVAQGILARGTSWLPALGLGAGAAALVAGLLVGGLFVFSKLPIGPAHRVAERVESVLSPFSAENDQLAHVLWFRQHIPSAGYGLGAVPWCGTLPAANCQGMPAQTQSDYTFTAVQGVVGPPAAGALLAGYLVWLGLLAVRQAAQTRGTLNPGSPGATEAAWLAWLAVCWAVLTVVQTGVTVMGNLGALPLTGVTWPFVSFGSWSMLLNAFVLGLVMHRLETAE